MERQSTKWNAELVNGKLKYAITKWLNKYVNAKRHAKLRNGTPKYEMEILDLEMHVNERQFTPMNVNSRQFTPIHEKQLFWTPIRPVSLGYKWRQSWNKWR